MDVKKRIAFFWILIPTILTCVFILILILHLIDTSFYKNIIQESLSSSIGKEVFIGKSKITILGGLGILFEDIRIKDNSGSFYLFQSNKVVLKIKIFPLIKKEIRFREIIFEKPKIHIIRYKNGTLNLIERHPKKEEKALSSHNTVKALLNLLGGSLSFRDGEIKFLDEKIAAPFIIEIRGLNLQLSSSEHQSLSFRVRGKVLQPKKEGLFSISGSLQGISNEFDLIKTKSEMEIELKEIDVFRFWPYLKNFIPPDKISGDLNLRLHYQGLLKGPFNISAKIKIKDLLLDYPKVFISPLKTNRLTVSFNLNYDSKNIHFPDITVELPEISIKAKGMIYSIGSNDMGIEAEARTNQFDLSEVKKFIPFKIITPKVSDALLKAEGRGPIQILSVKLSGKIPEIEQCDQPVNNHVISVELNLNGTRVSFPWKSPPLEELKGLITFKKGTLYLNDIEGKIWNSNFKRLNGSIYNLLHRATFSAKFEGLFNLFDLGSLKDLGFFPQPLNQLLNNISILSGTANYQLMANGNLQEPFQLHYQGSYRLSKVRFNSQDFTFYIDEGWLELSNEEIRWTGLKATFGNSSLSIDGGWKKNEKFSPFEIWVKGNIDIKNLFNLTQHPLIPETIRIKTKDISSLSGFGEFSLGIKTLQNPPYLSYYCKFLSKGASLIPKGIHFPIIFKEGTLSFSNDDLIFSKAKFTCDRSSISIHGSIKNGSINLSIGGNFDLKSLFSLLQSPISPQTISSIVKGFEEIKGLAQCDLKFFGKKDSLLNAVKEGRIKLKALSFKHQKIPLPISNLEGSFQLSNGKISIDGLRGKFGDSQIEIKGSIPRTLSDPNLRRLKWPISFNISSPNLDLDLIFPRREKKQPLSFKKIKDWLSILSIEGKIKVVEGRYKSLHYQDMSGEIKSIEEKIYFQPFQSKLNGGDIWGEGWAEPTEKGLRFEIRPRLSNVELKSFLRTLFSLKEEEKILISGKLHIYKVELRGEGDNFNQLKESLNGKLRLEINNGVIEKFNILSKIFSILNISQIFSGRLPDLKTKGLPYHQITANISFKDGVAQTDDLLLESDAMRITMVGSLDLSKNQIDATIGIHPLVTIDKVLSRIPIAGYILTGKDKAFLSYFYEVKGNLDDPKIEAIPFKTVGESLFGIIKRLLETPLRPFQKKHEDK